MTLLFETEREAAPAVFDFIEGWYNSHRRHSALGYLSPANYERRLSDAARWQILTPPRNRHNFAASDLYDASFVNYTTARIIRLDHAPGLDETKRSFRDDLFGCCAEFARRRDQIEAAEACYDVRK